MRFLKSASRLLCPAALALAATASIGANKHEDGDPAKTSARIGAFIAKKVDVIVIDPTDLAAQRAVDAGFPVIALGTVPHGGKDVE